MRRAVQIAWQLGGVLPRSVRALNGSGDWKWVSPVGLRQLGEVALDEFVVTGMTLTGPPPQLPRPLDAYADAAAELGALGIDGAHRDPEPLAVDRIEACSFGALRFEELSYRHDPALPESLLTDGHGGAATARARLYRSGTGRPWVIWIHGAGQGDPMDLMVARVRRLAALGFNVALPVQPGHGARRREWPEFPARDPLANIAGTVRVVSEVRALIGWLAAESGCAITVSGLSLGSAVAALVSHLDSRVGAVALYTPILGLNAMIGLHLGRWGRSGHSAAVELQSELVAAMTSVIDPLATLPVTDRRLIVGAWHDQMAMRSSALAMHERWGGELHWHDGSHVGHLFSGGVQAATERFLLAGV